MASNLENSEGSQKRINDLEAQIKVLQDSLIEVQRSHQAEPRSPRRTSGPHPAPINEDDESIGSRKRRKARRGSMDSRKTGLSTVVDGVSRRAMSVEENTDDSSDSDEGESFFANEPLPCEELDEDGLRSHLENHDFDPYSQFILQKVLDSERYAHKGDLFGRDAGHEEEDQDAQHHDADVYEVDKDGSPRPKIREESTDSDDHSQLWEVLRHTNADPAATQKAVGRIVVMREPTALLCAALHYTMSPHFDMDSIFQMLIDDQMSTRAYINGHLSKDHRHQRSIVFMFKYHTLVGEGRTPLPWQNHDDEIKRTADHIPISTCSAVVGLSFAGRHARKVKVHSRKSRQAGEESIVYDPFNPWHVLQVQAFPDLHSNFDVHQTKHHYVNGPDAFLTTLLFEYRDAVTRFKELSKAVVELATPPKEVVFNANYRDDLLFEHGDFKWSRRYFWAAQVLQILAQEIQDMITAYEDTFTEEFWKGDHKLFTGTADVSARYQNFRKKLTHTQKGFEKEIASLRKVLDKCNKDQKNIRMLREWLFSGTSVLESRSARKQDYNIKLLTLVTIIFTPLTFVTGIFGMTNMNPDENFERFGGVTLAVALPTYWLIFLISYHEKWQPIKTNLLDKYNKLLGKQKAERTSLNTRTKDRRRLRPPRQTSTHMTLERRLTGMSIDSSPGMKGSSKKGARPSFTQEMSNLSNRRDSATTPTTPKPPRRESTIQFREPFNDNRRHGSAIVNEPSPNTSETEQPRPPNRARSMGDGRPRRVSILRRMSNSGPVEGPQTSPV
jgi:hypothetical protein